MRHDAELVFDYSDARSAARVERAILPEVSDIGGNRTRTEVSVEGATLTVRIEATDMIALRAGLNTWCSLVRVGETVGSTPRD